MTTLSTPLTLDIAAPTELNATTVGAFREHARTAIQPGYARLDLDMRKTSFIDSSGLGAIIALHKAMSAQGGAVRLVQPRPQVLQILELTRMHRLMEITSL